MSIESFRPTACTMSRGFFVGILIGYAVKKVIKLVAVIVGLFFVGLASLQYHQIANINWNKLQTVSEGTITTLSNIITQISGFSSNSSIGDVHAAAASSLAMTNFGIPLTGRCQLDLLLDLSKDDGCLYRADKVKAVKAVKAPNKV